jgi:hypothetical protein
MEARSVIEMGVPQPAYPWRRAYRSRALELPRCQRVQKSH